MQKKKGLSAANSMSKKVYLAYSSRTNRYIDNNNHLINTSVYREELKCFV